MPVGEVGGEVRTLILFDRRTKLSEYKLFELILGTVYSAQNSYNV